jgi:phenylpyruvate tautomerase PptA (4-oxalocrotonate tautomerase family)
MLKSFLSALSLLAALLAPGAQGADPVPPAHAAHGSAGTIPGLKKELIEGITEADFMKLGDKPKTVKVTLVATFTDDNHGMNFDGFSHGKATWFIPVGWTVEVEFINPSPVPHSAIVIEREDTKKLQVPEPWFKGAAVAKHLQGIALAKAAFTFTPDEEGEFAFACGFPAHAIAGHWVALEVTAADSKPMLKFGDAEPKAVQ